MTSWQDWFQPHILERGRVYYDEGRVSELEYTEDGYTACVEGTWEYKVEILLNRGIIEDMLCDCPYAEDGNTCKHMAAVLFAIDADKALMKKTPAKKDRLTPAGLVAKIPEDRLRPLLTELISTDEKLYRDLLLQYGETSLEECFKTLKRELASIGERYIDYRGHINYRDADAFASDMADFIERQTQILLERDEPMMAFRAGMDALREFAGYDPEEECAYVDEAMDTMLEDILCTCTQTTASEIFDLLSECAASAGECWKVRDFAEQEIYSRFPGETFDKKRLQLIDRQIEKVRASGKQGYSGTYEIERLLVRRFDLMKKLHFPRKELDAFLVQHTDYSDIRKLRIRQALDEGNMNEAIRLLEEGKSVDRDKPGLVAEYSERLMDLYKQQGERDKLIAELEYHIFTLASGGIEMLNRLKKICTPVQWIEYRERYLSGRYYCKRELMESEELWDRLLEAVISAEYLSILDRYEAALKKRYPNEMLEAYIRVLTKGAAAASDRKQYRELAHYLKKIKRYPGGAERAAQLARDWRIRYGRRRAMMDELSQAGF